MSKYVLHWIDSVEIEQTFNSLTELLNFVRDWLGDDIEEVNG